MNREQFTYSVLQFRYRPDIGEVINLGVLFLFPGQQIHFAIPEKTYRLNHLYPEVNEKDLLAYLRSFNQLTGKLNKKLDLYRFDLTEIIREQYLIPNGSSLNFSAPVVGELLGSPEKTILFFSDLLLLGYKQKSGTEAEQINDHKVARIWHDQALKKKGLEERIKRVPSIHQRDTRITTNYQWHNGTVNFIKGFSFQLQTPESIIDKSLLLKGQLSRLGDYLTNKNYHLDLLLVKPAKKDLSGAYKEAVDILREAATSPGLIEKPKWGGYVNRIIEEGKPIETEPAASS